MRRLPFRGFGHKYGVSLSNFEIPETKSLQKH